MDSCMLAVLILCRRICQPRVSSRMSLIFWLIHLAVDRVSRRRRRMGRPWRASMIMETLVEVSMAMMAMPVDASATPLKKWRSSQRPNWKSFYMPWPFPICRWSLIPPVPYIEKRMRMWCWVYWPNRRHSNVLGLFLIGHIVVWRVWGNSERLRHWCVGQRMRKIARMGFSLLALSE